jgi:hypothetical protein
MAPDKQSSIAGRFYWLGVLVWALLVYRYGDALSSHLTWRINDLSAHPGAGYVARDNSGDFYHVSDEGLAREIYPMLAPAADAHQCLDCSMVNADQLSQINQFCVASSLNRLPALEFELPCSSWSTINDGPRAISFLVFLLPLLLLSLRRLRFARSSRFNRKP